MGPSIPNSWGVLLEVASPRWKLMNGSVRAQGRMAAVIPPSLWGRLRAWFQEGGIYPGTKLCSLLTLQHILHSGTLYTLCWNENGVFVVWTFFTPCSQRTPWMASQQGGFCQPAFLPIYHQFTSHAQTCTISYGVVNEGHSSLSPIPVNFPLRVSRFKKLVGRWCNSTVGKALALHTASHIGSPNKPEVIPECRNSRVRIQPWPLPGVVPKTKTNPPQLFGWGTILSIFQLLEINVISDSNCNSGRYFCDSALGLILSPEYNLRPVDLKYLC